VTFLIIAPYKYSYLLAYLLTDQFPVDNYLWQFYAITSANHVGKIFIRRHIECYNDTQMKPYDITKLTGELKNEDRNKIIYIIVVLFWCRRLVAIGGGSTAQTPYLDLLDIGIYRILQERRKILLNHSRLIKLIRNYTDEYGVCNFVLLPAAAVVFICMTNERVNN